MEIQPCSPQLTAKKLSNIVRIVFNMLKKGIANSKLMQELNIVFVKRGKLAGKAINDLVLHLQEDYTHSLTCRSSAADVLPSVVSRREYEFSCSNSPAYPAHIFAKRKAHYYHKPNYHHHHKTKDIQLMQKVFDILNGYERFEAAAASPMAAGAALPGFGQSPMVVRQLRVTDSPYSLRDHEEESPQVDKDAEEFIKRFYKDLKMQRRVAAVDSPSPYHYSSYWGR